MHEIIFICWHLNSITSNTKIKIVTITKEDNKEEDFCKSYDDNDEDDDEDDEDDDDDQDEDEDDDAVEVVTQRRQTASCHI